MQTSGSLQFVGRVGKAKIPRSCSNDLTQDLPEHDDDPDFYSDWADPRQYSIGDIGKGECAGEVVTQYEFEMTAAERMVFELPDQPRGERSAGSREGRVSRR